MKSTIFHTRKTFNDSVLRAEALKQLCLYQKRLLAGQPHTTNMKWFCGPAKWEHDRPHKVCWVWDGKEGQEKGGERGGKQREHHGKINLKFIFRSRTWTLVKSSFGGRTPAVKANLVTASLDHVPTMLGASLRWRPRYTFLRTRFGNRGTCNLWLSPIAYALSFREAVRCCI